MSTNTEKYGFMFMSQGAESYKNISIQSKYFMQLMELQYKLAQEQAKTWAPDPEHGIVAEMLGALFSAAKAAGDVFKQDAITSLITMGLVGSGILGVGAAALGTRTGELDSKIEDAEAMQEDLNAPAKAQPVLEQNMLKEKPDAAQEANGIKNPSPECQEKIDAMARGGKAAFENYQKKMTEIKEELPDKVAEQNALNREAVEQAKASPDREKISKNLKDYIDDLKSQRGKLEQQFSNWMQGIFALGQTLPRALEFPQDLKKATLQTASQTGQAVGQVLSDAEKKQAQFFETTAQKAAQEGEAADAVASSLAQVMQNRSGA